MILLNFIDSLKSLSVVKAEPLPNKVASPNITNILIESDGNKNGNIMLKIDLYVY